MIKKKKKTRCQKVIRRKVYNNFGYISRYDLMLNILDKNLYFNVNF